MKTHERLLAEWEGRAERLEEELAEHIPELAVRSRQGTADRRAVAGALPAGSALVEYVRVPIWDFATLFTQAEPVAPPARYVAFVLPAGQPEAVRLIDLGPAEAIDRLVTEHWAALVRAESPERKRALTAAGVGLRCAVFDQVATSLGDCRHLLLAPDGDLAVVPFDALPMDDGAYLIDRYKLRYVQTGRDLLRAGLPAPGTATPLEKAMTLVVLPETSVSDCTSLYDHRVLFLSGTWERPGNEFRFSATILIGKDGTADGSIHWQAVRVHGHPAHYFATEWVHGYIRGRDVELEGHKVERGLWPDSYRIDLSGDGEAGTYGGITRTALNDWGGRINGRYQFRNRNA